MTKDVITIRGSATIAEAIKSMRSHGLRTLIVNRRHPQDSYGIILNTDIIYQVAAYGKDPKKVRVYEVMTKPCITINPDLGIEYVARLFAHTQIHSAPVIKDELIGIISVTDILDKSDFVEYPKEIIFEEEIEKAVQHARQICSEKGHTSTECAAAWDIIEEMQAEAAHQRAKRFEKTALEQYIEENPQAADILMLDNWCSG